MFTVDFDCLLFLVQGDSKLLRRQVTIENENAVCITWVKHDRGKVDDLMRLDVDTLNSPVSKAYNRLE